MHLPKSELCPSSPPNSTYSEIFSLLHGEYNKSVLHQVFIGFKIIIPQLFTYSMYIVIVCEIMWSLNT